MTPTPNNDDVQEITYMILRQTIEIMCNSLRQLALTVEIDHPHMTPKRALTSAADAIENAMQSMQMDFTRRSMGRY